jgi:nitroreductase
LIEEELIVDFDSIEKMIYKRKSVRLLSDIPLAAEKTASILQFAQYTPRLIPEIRSSIRLLSRTEIQSFGAVSAPHYLAIYSEKSYDSQLNAGFILQQTDLYISSQNLGSCWLGMTKPKQTEYDGLSFVILLAFGSPEEEVHRTSIDQFKRKSVSEIAAAGAVPSYIDAIRLAPSAMNKQPWFFTGERNCCHAFSVRGKGLINIAEGWRFVDLGIAIAHLYLAVESSGKTLVLKRADSIPFRNGSEYVLSCRVD